MIQNGLDDCGLKKEKIDELYGAFGYISVKLRSDWTHFNAPNASLSAASHAVSSAPT